MDRICFSIIIPIYNAEMTLQRCLDSIIRQTFSDFEVLMVDDGSIDNSSIICKKYSSIDRRFKYLKKNNSGPSAARNLGLDNAQGEYIAFIDSDDYVNKDYLARINAAFLGQKADVVFISYKHIGCEERIIQIPLLEQSYYNDLILLSESNMFGFTWIKAFRKSIIKCIRFNNAFWIMEDELFTCEVLKQECIISTVSEPIYNYVQNENSLIYKVHDNYCEACENVYDRWKYLLSGFDAKRSSEYLKRKCNYLANNCKYYGLEKPVNVLEFFKKLSGCSFFIDCTINDTFIDSIKKKEWHRVKLLYIKYLLKNKIASLFK